MAQHEGSHTLSAYQSYASSVRFHPTTLPPTVSLLTVFSLLACDQASRAGDTTGLQSYGRWEWHGRIVAEPDSSLTLMRIRIDTTRGGGDVAVVRYDFDPSPGAGDEYALTLGLDFGNVRALRPGGPYELGSPPARVPAFATATCFCRPLRPDSVRGTFTLVTRAMRQITGRVAAALYFTAWDDPPLHAMHPLHTRLHALQPGGSAQLRG